MMNENLYRLIVDYQRKVQLVLKLMYRSGIQMPSSSYDWIEYNIPISGELDGGIKYYKHGSGCQVDLGSEIVDFDFGEHGEVGAFNSWWLAKFAGKNLYKYGFKSHDDIYTHLNTELNHGNITPLNNNLYYITNVPFKFALEIDTRNPGDKLPSRNHDRVLTLQLHYFETAELMFKNYNKTKQKMNRNGKLTYRDKFEMRIYISTWLGFLGVVCEGFRKLNMRIVLNKERPSEFKELTPVSDRIGKLMKEHSDSLRIFRNNVFHLREDNEHVHLFFHDEVDRLQWAHELHIMLSDFFSKYQYFCEVHYVINGRIGESNLVKKKLIHKNKL